MSRTSTTAPTPRIVIATLMRRDGGTGVQSHVRTFTGYLRDQGRAVDVVSPFSARSPLVWPVFGLRRAIQPVTTAASVWWYRHWHARYLESALRRQLSSRPGPTVIYAQCPVSARAALRARTDQPVVMAAHFNVSQAEEWVEKGDLVRGGRLYAAIDSFEDRILTRLDAVVYVSAFSQRAIQGRRPGVVAVPSAVIPNPVPILKWPQVEPDRDLITVGSLEPRKNQAYLLRVLHEAALRGRRFLLTVVGDGPQRGALEQQCARLGLTDQVRFVGHRSDVTALMGLHRAYCHTATVESFGIVLAEAMSQGLPVVTGDVGGIGEVVRPGVDGEFWPLDDPVAAADVLIRLMGDPARRESMGRAGRNRVAETFSTDVVGARLVGFLDAAWRRSGEPPGNSRVRRSLKGFGTSVDPG